MKWKKLGKIFDPRDHFLANNCVEFAQSPQTLVFDDYVRIYFSSRERDKTGKFLSHVSFVDMDKTFRKVIRVSAATVIELGGLGSFDEHGIFPMNVCKTSDHLYAYTTGWNRRVSVSTDAAIGLAISDDGGETYNKVGKGPVLTCSLTEPFLVGDAFVAVYGSTFHMWYIHGTKWAIHAKGDAPDRVYKIAHATSDDGKLWRKEGRQIIADKLNGDECQALPTVIFLDKQYKMLFCFRHSVDFRKNKSRGYRLGYACSDDLVNWTRDDDNVGIDVTPGSWDSDMICYPHMFEMDGEVYLMYNGNEFGRFGFGLARLEK